MDILRNKGYQTIIIPLIYLLLYINHNIQAQNTSIILGQKSLMRSTTDTKIASLNVLEGDSINLSISLPSNTILSYDVTFIFKVSGTASLKDYITNPAMHNNQIALTIPSGKSKNTITVYALSDMILEQEKTMIIQLIYVPPPFNIGADSIAVIHIQDATHLNPENTTIFLIPDSTKIDGCSQISIKASLPSGVYCEQDISLPFPTIEGSAIKDVHYLSKSIPSFIHIPAQKTSMSFNLISTNEKDTITIHFKDTTTYDNGFYFKVQGIHLLLLPIKQPIFYIEKSYAGIPCQYSHMSFFMNSANATTDGNYQWYLNHQSIPVATNMIYSSRLLHYQDTLSCIFQYTSCQGNRYHVLASLPIIIDTACVDISITEPSDKIIAFPNPVSKSNTHIHYRFIASKAYQQITVFLMSIRSNVLNYQQYVPIAPVIEGTFLNNNLPGGIYMLIIKAVDLLNIETFFSRTIIIE